MELPDGSSQTIAEALNRDPRPRGVIDSSLSGRVALVTGANHGIGAAIAIALARRGAAVLATFLALGEGDAEPGQEARYLANRAQDASATVTTIRAAGGTVAAVAADLTDPASAPALFDAAEARFGRVEILICNASGWRQDTFAAAPVDTFGRATARVTAASFASVFDVDARASALLVAELASRHVAAGGDWGRIVSLTSGGPDGFPAEVSYGAAKAALENYTLSAAWELGRHGITANALDPGATDTGWVTPAIAAAVTERSPTGEVGTPENVAAVVCLLCSDDAARLTGNVIRLR